MPITYKNGNAVSALIDGEIDVLLHVCNNKGVMGSGIALEIKNRIPDAYTKYLGFSELGEVSFGKTDSSNVVANMVAQNGYGAGKRFLNYGALADCLNQVRKECGYGWNGGLVIGLPFKMGADRAGGDWEIVLELIEYFLKDFNVVIYKLEN